MNTHNRIFLLVSLALSAASCGVYDFAPSPELQALKKARNAPAPVVALAMVSQKTALALGRCNSENPITLQALGTNGTPVPVPSSSGIAVSFVNFLTAVSTLYLDSSCTQPVPVSNGKPVITLAKGMDRRVFYVKPLQQPNNGLRLTANADGYSQVSLDFSIDAVPMYLRFVSPKTTIGAGLCHAYQARVEDFLNRPVNSGFPASLQATLRGLNGIFYSDADCQNRIGSANSDTVNLAFGASPTISFFLKVGQIGQFTLALTSNVTEISGESRVINVVAAVTQLAITGGPPGANVRLGVLEATQFSVVALDVNSNQVLAANDILITMSGPAEFQTTGTPPFKIASGSNAATFKVRATAAGQITIRASAPVGSQIAFGEKVLNVAVTQEDVDVTAGDIVGGVPTLIEIKLKDGAGNEYVAPAPGFDANLSMPVTPVSFCSQETCAPGSVLNPAKLNYNGVSKRTVYVMVDPDADQQTTIAVQTPSGTFNKPLQLRRRSLQGDKRFRVAPDGQTTVSFSGPTQDAALAAASAGNNTVVAAGWTGGDNGDRSVAVTRIFAHHGAQPGQPDPAFGTNGKAVFGVGDSASSAAIGIAPMVISASERYVVGVATTSSSGDSDFAVVRLTNSGAIDTTFGDQGVTTVALSGNQVARAMAVSPNTKNIYIVGSTDGALGGGNDFVIMGFTPNGARLTTFGGPANNGVVPIDVGGNDDAFAIVIPERVDLKDYPLIGGISSNGANSDFAFVSLKPDGTLNNLFNSGGAPAGVRKVSVGTGGHFSALSLQGNGKILGSGYLDSGATVMVKLSSTGALETGFGTNGKVSANLAPGAQKIFASAFDLLGKFYIAGSMAQAGGNEDYFLARINPDTGALDAPPMTTVGVYDFAGNATDAARALLVVSGKPLMVGQGYDGAAGRRTFGFQSALR